MPKQPKPNYFELYYDKRGGLTFRLRNGNNHKKLVSACEGYKNKQVCLRLLDSVCLYQQINFYPKGSRTAIAVCLRFKKNKGKTIYLIDELTTESVKL